MPASPEIRDGAGQVGIPEILRNLEPEHPPQPDRHVRVSGKIEIDLKRVAGHPQPRDGYGEVFHWQGEDGVGRNGQRVRDDHLLAETDDETTNSQHRLSSGEGALCQLPGNLRVADDGAGHQLREQRDVEGQIGESALHLAGATGYVKQVGNGLEGEERDADRQFRIWGDDRAQPKVCQPGVEFRQQPTGVFEPSQQAEIRAHTEPKQGVLHPSSAVPVQTEAESVVDADGCEEEERIGRLVPRIKKDARERQGRIADANRKKWVEQQQQRQEQEEKNRFAECHLGRGVIMADRSFQTRGKNRPSRSTEL